jgi:negative regulator of genetic competence, sporulation and motility
MKNKIIASAALSCILLISCKRSREYQETGDKALKVRITELKNERSAPGILGFKARLIPTVEAGSNLKVAVQTSLLYHMDSCFYLHMGAEKRYPVLIQPVASGIKNSFDYLIEFEKPEDANDHDVLLVYQDKFFTSRNYSFKIEN